MWYRVDCSSFVWLFCLFESSMQGFLSNLWSCTPKICWQSLSQRRNYTREHSGNLNLVFSLITETKYKRTEEHIMAYTLILVTDNVSVNTKICGHEKEGITNGCNMRCFTFFVPFLNPRLCWLGNVFRIFKTSHWWHHMSHWERVRGHCGSYWCVGLVQSKCQPHESAFRKSGLKPGFTQK